MVRPSKLIKWRVMGLLEWGMGSSILSGIYFFTNQCRKLRPTVLLSRLALISSIPPEEWTGSSNTNWPVMCISSPRGALARLYAHARIQCSASEHYGTSPRSLASFHSMSTTPYAQGKIRPHCSSERQCVCVCNKAQKIKSAWWRHPSVFKSAVSLLINVTQSSIVCALIGNHFV